MSELEAFYKQIKSESSNVLTWLVAIIAMLLFVTIADESFYASLFQASNWQKYSYHHIAVFVVFMLFPLFLVLWQKESLKSYGLQVVEWKKWSLITLGLMIVFTPMIYISSFDPAFLKEYPLAPSSMNSPSLFIQWAGIYVFYYLGWEFFFRGFLQKRMMHLGVVQAIFIQTALSTIIHIGKPTGELIAAFPGGIIFGIMAYRSKSLLWPFVLHLYIGVLNSYFCGIH